VLVSRRELLRLTAAAGAGALLAGCPPASGTRLPPLREGPPGGAIHGQDAGLGHLLRDGDLLARRPDETRELRVLVVGGGVAGLTCAWRLRRDGVADDVLGLDAGRRPGGNARHDENEVSAYPWGAHYLRAPTVEHRALETFLVEVGLIRGYGPGGRIDWDTRALCSAPLERLYEGGLWAGGLLPPRSATAADRAELDRFEDLVAALASRRDAEGRPAFAIPAELSSSDPDLRALDEETFAAWLARHDFTSLPVLWYLDYACRDDYGCTLDTTSAWAGLHYFAARRTVDPTRDVILTWPEGNGHLVGLLAGAVGDGVRFRGRSLCFRVTPGAAPGDPSEALVYEPEADRVIRYRARNLVWAGPRFVLAHVLEAPPPGSQAFSYSPWLVANVTLDVPPAGVGAELCWDNVSYDHRSLGYVVANRGAKPHEPCVVTYYKPLADQDPAQARADLLALDHATIVEQVTEELLEIHPTLEGRVRSVDAWRWGHALIRPTPGFLWGPDRARALEPIGALLCANSDLSGIPIFEEAFYRGVLAGEEILRREGLEHASLL
jgi:NAD(P)-binding Rossmann-like domain